MKLKDVTKGMLVQHHDDITEPHDIRGIGIVCKVLDPSVPQFANVHVHWQKMGKKAWVSSNRIERAQRNG